MSHRKVGVFVAYCDLLLVIVSLLIVSIAPKRAMEGVRVEAQYLVSLEWDRMSDDDLDLWGLGPTGKPCFYESVEVGALTLDRDSRGYMDDRVNVEGHLVYLPHKEVMTLRGVIPGRYSYGIHAYKARPSDDRLKRDPRALGIIAHVEVIKINPKVTTIFRKDITLQFEGEAQNFWAMDVLPDGNFVEADPPVEPITARFYQSHPGAAGSSYVPGAATMPGAP